MSRSIGLAFLAPDIAEKIRLGQERPELTAGRLTQAVPLPMAWEEQRVLLGV